jgi:hypothetical protein
MDPDSDPGGPKTCGSGFGSATMLEFLKQTKSLTKRAGSGSGSDNQVYGFPTADVI